MNSREYEYEVALSFAGEDRPYVERVARFLQEKNILVFYDEFERSNLWGKDLYAHLHDVYHNKARFCVMFISEHYARKSWTNHERRSAQARAFEANEEYILPARFDATVIPGVRPTLGYMDLSNLTAEQFAKEILRKIGVPPTEECATRESWESYGWLFDVDGYRVAYIPLLNDWRAQYKERVINDVEIHVDSERYRLPDRFRQVPISSNFLNHPSCRLDFYSLRKDNELELRFKETSYADYLRSGEHLDDPFPGDSRRTYRDELGRVSRSQSGDLRPFDLTNICGVGLFILTRDSYILATTHSKNSHVYPTRKTFAASGTMRWGCFPDPFTEVLRKAEKEINHLVNPRELFLVGFGVDARKLYFQFSFLERSQSSLREIREFARKPEELFPIPFSLEQICSALLKYCWEPAAEATLLTLSAQRFGRNDVARCLFDRQEEWKKREMSDEWDYRASRPGLLPDMSVRYPFDELRNGSSQYIAAAFRFMGKDVQRKRILEVGSGTGRFTKRLESAAAQLTCVELSKRMIDHSRKKLGKVADNVRFIEAFAQDCLPLPGHDIVVCSLVLIHNVREADFQSLVSGLCGSSNLIFLFEDITQGRKTSPYTRLRSEEALENAFLKEGFVAVKRRYYQLFSDKIVFLKLQRKTTNSGQQRQAAESHAVQS